MMILVVGAKIRTGPSFDEQLNGTTIAIQNSEGERRIAEMIQYVEGGLMTQQTRKNFTVLINKKMEPRLISSHTRKMHQFPEESR